MELRIHCVELLCLLISLSTATTFLAPCEARGSRQLKNFPHPRAAKHPRSPETRALKQLGTYSSSNPTNDYYYMVGSPLSLPTYQDVMDPSSTPLDNPIYCVYPPPTPLPPSTTLPTPVIPLPPSTTLPTPVIPLQSPPPPTMSTTPPVLNPNPPGSSTQCLRGYNPSPPEFVPGPPTYLPNPPEYVPNPPGTVPSPPEYEPSPPPTIFVPSPTEYAPGPPKFVPGPPVFEPPVVYPAPSGTPPLGTTPGLWCVAKPTVPDPMIQEALNYACGSGADCDSIQPNGSCYQPDTLIAHASFALNSYWQQTKVTGGTCDFGGTATLITRDPSYGSCHFIIY